MTILTAALAVVARAEEDFPYKAYAAIEGAEVVSGPGHRYYATGHLPLGAKVEIYREESSGWLAIRPPAGSFSWVEAEFIERDEDDVAVVGSGGCTTFVGRGGWADAGGGMVWLDGSLAVGTQGCSPGDDVMPFSATTLPSSTRSSESRP